LKLRRLADAPADLSSVDRLVMEAYNVPSRRRELEMYLAAQPDGWFVLVDGSEIVSVGGGFRYGSFCWLGLVATKPTRQRQGLATRISTHLVDWARRRGSTTIALDASEAGRRVYEQLGFRVVGETTELSLPPVVADEKAPSTVRCDTRTVEQLLALDRRIFGGDRAGLLRSLSRQADARCYFALNGDEEVGYLFVRNRLVGPGVAWDADIARDLLRAAIIDRRRTSVSEEQRLLLPVESRYLDVASRLDFRIERRLAHMRLGDPVLPGKRRELLAQTSFAAG
jgi:GNAT superfamily N-acetyltransferase